MGNKDAGGVKERRGMLKKKSKRRETAKFRSGPQKSQAVTLPREFREKNGLGMRQDAEGRQLEGTNLEKLGRGIACLIRMQKEKKVDARRD